MERIQFKGKLKGDAKLAYQIFQQTSPMKHIQEMLFVTMKFRKLYFDRRSQSDTISLFLKSMMKWTSENSKDIQYLQENQRYLIDLFHACKNELAFLDIDGCQNLDDVNDVENNVILFDIMKNLEFQWIPVQLGCSMDYFTYFLSWITICLLCLVFLQMIFNISSSKSHPILKYQITIR